MALRTTQCQQTAGMRWAGSQAGLLTSGHAAARQQQLELWEPAPHYCSLQAIIKRLGCVFIYRFEHCSRPAPAESVFLLVTVKSTCRLLCTPAYCCGALQAHARQLTSLQMLQHLEVQGILPDDWWRWQTGWLNSAGGPHRLQELHSSGPMRSARCCPGAAQSTAAVEVQ